MATNPLILPGGFVTEAAIAFRAADGNATGVDAANPLPVSDQPFSSAQLMVPGVEQPPRRAIAVASTAAGALAMELADESIITISLPVGLSILPFAVKNIVAGGTTVTATFYNLA